MTPMIARIPPPTSPPRAGLLTVEQAADYLKIAPGTLKNWIRAKRIEYVRVGKQLRFTQAALDRYIAGQTVAAVEE